MRSHDIRRHPLKRELVGFQTKKSLGQHFLTDPNIAKRIAKEGQLTSKDTVLEIGPGTGNLTVHLLASGAQVVAIEPDRRAIEELEARFPVEISEKRLILSHNDVREVDFAALGLVDGHFKIIANIPYYISGLLLRLSLSGSIKPSSVVFLVQKEVAERIAREKKESLLSLSVKAYGIPHYAFTVKRGSFAPQPKVDSAVLVIDSVSKKRFDGVPEKAFFELLHTGFGSRRKQLKGLLKSAYGEQRVSDAFTELNIPEKARAEDLHIGTWMRLVKQLVLSTRNAKK